MAEYLIVCNIKIQTSDFPDKRLLRFDHVPLTNEVHETVNNSVFALDEKFYQNAKLTSYRLHAIDHSTINEQSKKAKIVFIGSGSHNYVFVYCRNCIGHATHGYVQFTFDQPIVENNVEPIYDMVEETVRHYIGDPISSIQILLHSPVN